MKDFGKELCTAQAFTTDAVSENTYDLAAADKNMGNAGIVIHLRVNTTFTGTDSGVRIFVVDSAAAALTSDRAIAMFSSTTCSDAGVIPAGDLTAGTELMCFLPPAIKLKRYLGLHWLPVSEAGATGDVDAWVSNIAGEIDLQ